MALTLIITDADDLAGISGETNRHNKANGTNLTPQQFMETVALANMLRSWKHDHVDQTVDALRDRLQRVEGEKMAAEGRAVMAEQALADKADGAE